MPLGCSGIEDVGAFFPGRVVIDDEGAARASRVSCDIFAQRQRQAVIRGGDVKAASDVQQTGAAIEQVDQAG